MQRQLFRSKQDKILAGVLGGIGDYFKVDPTIIRAAFVLLDIFTGIIPGIIAYFILAIIIPPPPAI